MSHAVITVENLSKAYRIGLKEEIPDTLVGAATSWLKAPMRNFHRLRKLNTFSANGDAEEDIIWALRDVSFEVAEGEVLGIIGRNGAGKSTLLKILSRITEPTCGRAVIHGRVSSLLEVGTGFHPELSGRENIYMNGTILGMRKKEIDRKLDAIIDFSGVEKFLDTPIKRYSSGMKVRLAFSVAAHLEPEILIIDEVLAVGDAEFQKKCLGKMQDVAIGGRTVLFVSHNMAAVTALCSRAMQLYNGTVAQDGTTAEVVQHYAGGVREMECFTPLSDRHDRQGTGQLRFTSISVTNSSDPTAPIYVDSDLKITLSFNIASTVQDLDIGFHIDNALGAVVYRTITRDTYGPLPKMQGERTIICHLIEPRFMPGHYRVHVVAHSGKVRLDLVADAAFFDIEPRDVYGTGRLPSEGILLPRCDWQFEYNSSVKPRGENASSIPCFQD